MASPTPLRDIYGARLSRRHFVKTGGALIVGVGVLGLDGLKRVAHAAGRNELDPTLPASWIEIHADNTFLIRTGRCDFGQSTIPVAYRQIVAEELHVSFDAITAVVSGDTDRTPDGGPSVDLLGRGAPNMRKAAAYTYQALLDLAATRLGVAKDQLSAKDGIVSGGGRSVSYGDLVKGQQLKLTIPVTGSLGTGGIVVSGNPPTKPVSQYSVVGKSFLNDVVAAKVSAKKDVWVSDVKLPGMLHGRMVHPRTLGSTLVSVGQLDKTRFPNAQVVVERNFVGVVAPTEWDAIRAAQQVAAGTKWTDWKGLPGSDNVFKWMRDGADWKTTPLVTSEKSTGNVEPALASATKTLTATYEMPYIKHAPIGPPVCVADVRADGTVFVHTHNQNPQALRFLLARMLDTSADNVVVRAYAGSGHYGRSNGGNPGAEDEAVLLSKAVGKPVRLQWMRAEDFQWSTQSPIGYSDVQIALNANGTITGYRVAHHMPPMQDDRLVAALLAGRPTISNGSGANRNLDPWHYDRIENVLEHGFGTSQIGQQASPIAVGLRDHSLRTPGQFQQNHPRELAMSEAAAMAGADALSFRLRHTKDPRLSGVLEAVRDASGWESRAAPHPRAAATGSTPVTGQGVSVMIRKGGYWACVCQVQVVPSTGRITVTKYTVALDLGIVVNPLQLKRQVEGGAVMGISHALLEEATFDESVITSRDWRSYPISTMADVPEIKVVMLNRPEVGDYKQGSETANALAAPAIAAALFDATGKIARRLPLRPAYVQSLLKA